MLNISVLGRLRPNLAESHDQTPLMDLFMDSSSEADADQVLLTGKPLNGGGPLNCTEST